MRAIIALLFMTHSLYAEGERAGDFDYYVLSLSWSPNWCLREGDARNSPQCNDERDLGWVLHGLWPQHENGWPSYCSTSARDPSRTATQAMADIMGTSGAAWYQWKKHGRCAGISADDFYRLSREAYELVNRPAVFRSLDRSVDLPASVVEDAFVQANPELSRGMITVTCKQKQIQEVRLCLTKQLLPRNCSPDVARDCTEQDAFFAPIN